MERSASRPSFRLAIRLVSEYKRTRAARLFIMRTDTKVLRLHVPFPISRERIDGVHHLRNSSRGSVVPRPRRAAPAAVPWWAVVAAGAAPALLIGGFVVAAGLQPASYSPIRDTISALAAQGATDPWVMTTAVAAAGTCYLLTAFGFRPARRAGRVALACGGVATVCIAAFPQPQRGYSVPHEAAVVAACTAMCAWPVLGARRQYRARLLTLPASLAATAVTVALTMWFVFEQHQPELGLAERCAAVAAASWLFPVVLTTRLARDRSAPQPSKGDFADADLPAARSSALRDGSLAVANRASAHDRGAQALPGPGSLTSPSHDQCGIRNPAGTSSSES
jgi:hypothetical membrane protein